MRRTMIAFSAAIVLLAAAGQPSPSVAQEGEICNPVMDRRAAPVVDRRGNPVVHRGSFECPPEEVAAPEPAPPAPPPAPFVLDGDLTFEFDSARIRPEFFGELDAIAAELNEHPDRQVRVSGHTCTIGSAAYNQGLSERRAQSVADYLTARGVSADRLIVQGFGETQPVATNETREGRAQNRRVEIETL